MSDQLARLRAGMAAIWKKSLPHVREQVSVLEDAIAALLENNATPEQLQNAEREAHRLAGSVGSFGFDDASRAAREIEHMLQDGGSIDLRRASDLVVTLRADLDTETLPGAEIESASTDQPEPQGTQQSSEEVLDILVVEDDETIAELLLHAFQTRGYKVKRLTDGQAAVDAVSGPKAFLQPRLVLLDVDLPGLNGISVLRSWRQSNVLDKLRVIMLTVRSAEPDILETLKLDAFDHIAKPFSISVLMQRVRRALET